MVWSDESRQLSERLQVMADKILPGESCADVGTDHGYLGCYLYAKGISPKVIMTDISEDSLAKAKATAGAGQFGTDVAFRLGNGLEVIGSAEVDCVVIAGMGGLLIRDILAADVQKTKTFKRFVLQPRTASGPLRKWLLEEGFAIMSEDIVREGAFLPEIITAAPLADSSEEEVQDFDYFEHDSSLVPAEGRIVDLASGIRESLVNKQEPGIQLTEEDLEDLPDEDSIHFAVPVWMLNASGPVREFLKRRIGLQEDVLEGLMKAKVIDEVAVSEAKYNIEYLKQLSELRTLIEEHEQQQAEESTDEVEK